MEIDRRMWWSRFDYSSVMGSHQVVLQMNQSVPDVRRRNPNAAVDLDAVTLFYKCRHHRMVLYFLHASHVSASCSMSVQRASQSV